MNITSDICNVRATSVAFVTCFDGRIVGRTVHMTACEERRPATCSTPSATTG